MRGVWCITEFQLALSVDAEPADRFAAVQTKHGALNPALVNFPRIVSRALMHAADAVE